MRIDCTNNPSLRSSDERPASRGERGLSHVDVNIDLPFAGMRTNRQRKVGRPGCQIQLTESADASSVD